MKIAVENINETIRAGKESFVAQVDGAYLAQIQTIADDICAHAAERPIILLAGPSGSGKTTSALLLEHLLDNSGYETHTLSMDDYYLPFNADQLELVNQGKIDLESPGRLDIPFLNEQLADILAGRSVELPRYDFAASARVKRGVTLQRHPGELVILEGIHALNPEVISLPEDQTCRIYVSVRTRVTVGDHTLHPAFIRLVRRMLRDRATRGRSFAETIRMFESVQRGENRYIMPFKSRSNFDIDTFHAYELSVYKTMLNERLPAYSRMAEIAVLQQVLDTLEPLPSSQVPAASLIREFVGGSEPG